MRGLLSLAAASILLALPAAAHANLDLDDRAVAAAISAGESVWQDNPCAGQTTYRYLADEQVVAEHPDDPDAARILGYAPISGAYRGNCTVTLASQRAWTARDLCMIVAHEHGHLLGLQHTDDRNDLMYPYLGDGVTIYGCHDLTELAARQLVDVQITVSVTHRAKPKRARAACPGRGFENGRPGGFETTKPKRSNRRPGA